MRTTHPRYAQLAARNLIAISTHSPALTIGIQGHVKQLIKAGTLKVRNPELRLRNLSSVIFGTMQVQLLDTRSKDTDAELAIEIALGMLGITPAKAHKRMTAPLPTFDPPPAPF
jgi:hypothetical protein